MLIEMIIGLALGILAGTICGLAPGIHINLVGAMLVSLSLSTFAHFQPIYLVVFIVSMAISQSFIDFIPSIFLGCPDTETSLSVLPGHELLKQGKGYAAVLLTAYGGLAAIFILIIVSYPLTLAIPVAFNAIKKLIPYILIVVSVLLIVLEKKKIKAFIVFLFTGLLGLAVLNLEFNQPLLPLLTGLFGASALILSIKNKTQIPNQEISQEKTNLFKPIMASLIASPLCGFLPGLGSGQASIIGNAISRTDRKGFLVLLGSINVLVMGFSFIALYTISKTRTGAAAAIKEIIGFLPPNILILILISVLISGIISFFLTKKLALFASQNITKINYPTISLLTLLILVVVVFLVSGFIGIFVLIASTITGIYSISQEVKRTNMMGCLLLPTIILYLF